MNSTHDNILAQIKKIVNSIDPTAEVYLYGSRTKKNFNNDSDWDVLILVDDHKLSAETDKEISYSLYELEFETGQLISPVIYSKSDWHKKFSVTSFFNNVMKQAVPL